MLSASIGLVRYQLGDRAYQLPPKDWLSSYLDRYPVTGSYPDIQRPRTFDSQNWGPLSNVESDNGLFLSSYKRTMLVMVRLRGNPKMGRLVRRAFTGFAHHNTNIRGTDMRPVKRRLNPLSFVNWTLSFVSYLLCDSKHGSSYTGYFVIGAWLNSHCSQSFPTQ
jgi:hypothetical protein